MTSLRNGFDRRIAPRVAAGLAVAAGVLFWSSGARADDAMARIRERGKLTMLCFPHLDSQFVRTNTAFGPMPKVGSKEHFLGVDVEIMASFADRLGVELEVRPVSHPGYAELIPELLEGRGDLIASSLTITAERARKVDFSDPYFSVHPVVVTGAGSPLDHLADLEGKVAVAVTGSSQEQRLRALGVPLRRIDTVEFSREGYEAVAEGRADFVLIDSGAAELVLAEMPDLELAFELPDAESYGFAVPPGSNLLPVLNQFLAEIRQSGRLAEILDARTR